MVLNVLFIRREKLFCCEFLYWLLFWIQAVFYESMFS
jgi:hypothetical protein